VSRKKKSESLGLP